MAMPFEVEQGRAFYGHSRLTDIWTIVRGEPWGGAHVFPGWTFSKKADALAICEALNDAYAQGRREGLKSPSKS